MCSNGTYSKGFNSSFTVNGRESTRKEKCICQDVILKEYIIIIDYNIKIMDYYQTSYASEVSHNFTAAKTITILITAQE